MSQHRIQQLLGWNELQYAQFVYDTGCAYLQAYIPGNEEAIAALERSRVYWAWWKNHWQQRDRQFLQTVNPYAPAQVILTFYERYNNAHRLAGRVWPNAVVLNDSYARMIGEFNDEILQHDKG